MKSIEYILLLILCVGLIGGASNVSAQIAGDRVLMTGKNPLKESEVENMIRLYEWVFETEFTADERVRFQGYTINEYRNDPVGSRTTVDDVVQTLPRILALDADGQAAVRRSFLNGFLPSARQSKSENSRMLVGIYERGQNGEQLTSGNTRNSDPVIANGNRTNASTKTNGGKAGGLSGKWHRGVGSGHIDYTGKTQYKSGEDFYFEFFPDGTVIYTSKLDVLSIMQCTIKGENKASGTYAVVGDSLTINLDAMNSVKTNSCDKKENYNKTLEPTSKTVKFVIRKMESITRPDNPTLLCFDGASDDSCFERVK